MIVSVLTNLTVVLVLSLALCIAALLSILLLRVAPSRLLEVSFEPEVVRGFKGEAVETAAKLRAEPGLWGTARLVEIIPPKGVLATLGPPDGGSYDLRLLTTFAGRFEGFVAEVEMPDALGLFTRSEVAATTPLCLESLPLGLLARPSVVNLRAIALGEYPSGARGSGQEFYAAEPYSGVSDAHDILWRQMAKRDDETFVFKVREANVPEAVRLLFLELEERGPGLPRWMDLVSEATSRIGISLLEAGVRMTVVSRRQGAVITLEVEDLRELADATVEMWSGSSPQVHRLEYLPSQIVLTGIKELRDAEVANLVGAGPSIIVAEDTSQGSLGQRMVVFSGSEDVGSVVQAVLLR